MKLPDIQYRRNVPQIRSGKMAALPTKLRNIDAAVGAVQGVVQTTDKAFEQEAKLDAGRRYQEVQRNYTAERASLIQEFHNTDKDAETFTREVNQLRQETFNQATKTASARARRYLAPALDRFRTQTEAFEIEALDKLLDSRKKLSLDIMLNEQVEMVSQAPELTQSLVKDYNEQLVNNGLSQVENQALRVTNTTTKYTAAVDTYIRRGTQDSIEAAQALMQTKAWELMSQEDQQTLEGQVNEARDAFITDATEDTAKMLRISGSEADLDTAITESAAVVESVSYGLTDKEVADRAEVVQGEMAFQYLGGQIQNGKVNEVRDILKSGKYNKVLSIKQSQQLYDAATSAEATGTMNDKLFEYEAKRAADEMATLLSTSPNVDPTAVSAALARVTAAKDAKKAAGKDYSGLYTAEQNLVDAVQDAQVGAGVFVNPVKNAPQLDGSPESVRYKISYDKWVEERNTQLAVSPTAFYRENNMRDVAPLPRNFKVPLYQDDQWFDVLGNDRLTDYKAINEREPGKIGGIFEPNEMAQLSQGLKGTTTDEMLAVAAQFARVLPADKGYTVYEQLAEDPELRLFPTVAKLSLQGSTEVANGMLQGQVWLDDPNSVIKPDQMQAVKETITEELGTGFGLTGSMQWQQAHDASVAYYTYRKGMTKDFSLDKMLVEESVRAVTNGVLEVGGQKFIAPVPNMTDTSFVKWMQNLDETNLPSGRTRDGDFIPAQDISEGLFRDTILGGSGRFRLVESGKPGEYYVQDQRGRNARGARPTTTGVYLMSDDDITQLLTVSYDPSIVKPFNANRSGQGGRGRRQ